MRKKLLALIFSFFIFSPSYAIDEGFAPVSGFARSFLTGESISNASIQILETGQKIKTDEAGRFGPFNYPVNKPMTLVFSKKGFITTQSETTLVPRQGLTNRFNNITFQVPSTYTYYLLSQLIGAKIDKKACHLTTTILSYHKTLDDIPQGEPDAKVMLLPYVNVTPFYFDIFKSGPLKNKTYPFSTGLSRTSTDGGVAFFNVPPRKEAYRLIAIKSNVVFSEAQFICRPDTFINISPPRGPMVQQ